MQAFFVTLLTLFVLCNSQIRGQLRVGDEHITGKDYSHQAYTLFRWPRTIKFNQMTQISDNVIQAVVEHTPCGESNNNCDYPVTNSWIMQFTLDRFKILSLYPLNMEYGWGPESQIVSDSPVTPAGTFYPLREQIIQVANGNLTRRYLARQGRHLHVKSMSVSVANQRVYVAEPNTIHVLDFSLQIVVIKEMDGDFSQIASIACDDTDNTLIVAGMKDSVYIVARYNPQTWEAVKVHRVDWYRRDYKISKVWLNNFGESIFFTVDNWEVRQNASYSFTQTDFFYIYRIDSKFSQVNLVKFVAKPYKTHFWKDSMNTLYVVTHGELSKIKVKENGRDVPMELLGKMRLRDRYEISDSAGTELGVESVVSKVDSKDVLLGLNFWSYLVKLNVDRFIDVQDELAQQKWNIVGWVFLVIFLVGGFFLCCAMVGVTCGLTLRLFERERNLRRQYQDISDN